MRAFGVLGHVEVPERIHALVPALQKAWKESGRRVWELPRRRPWQHGGDHCYLDETTSGVISGILESLGLDEYDAHGHSLLLFGNVPRHDDGPVSFHGHPAAFFHLILNGSGTLRLPGLRDKAARDLELTKGLAFWFNPEIKHLVKDTSTGGLASLTATIRFPRPIREGPKRNISA